RRKWPLVSVVIPAHNEALSIKRTLDSALASDYAKFELIIIDDGSKDDTVAIIRNYIKKHPKLRARSYTARYDWSKAGRQQRRYVRGQIGKHRVLLVSQINGGKASAMNNAITNHVRGELTMCLDADSILHPAAISRAVGYFKDRKVIGVAANVRVMSSKQWLGVLQRFEHMIGYRSKKFYSLTNSEFIIGGVASTYRTRALQRAGLYDTDTMTEDIGLSLKLISKKGNRRHRIVYAADVVAMTEGVQTFRGLLRQRYRWKMGNLQNLFKYRHLIGNTNHRKYSRMLTRYRMPMAVLSEVMLILEPVLLSYVVYLSISYHTPGILFGAYLTLTSYVLWTVWPDEHLTNRQKAQLSFLALGMYLLFYAMDIVQLYAAFQCLRQRHTITRRDGEHTWVSPLRTGQAASF
ncbi:MAG TPA: glycosyltransferase family 2 protein, partial [Verrucomicrobiae bacterium]|nr:glycosyltransferase family 2 protein [Verrucomicrobiae bacterium]